VVSARSRMSEKRMYKYVVPFRARVSSFTYPIAVCTTCTRVIPPACIKYCTSSGRGALYFAHIHQLDFIWLETSKGVREVDFSAGIPPRLREFITCKWVDEEAWARGMRHFFAKFLSLMRG
jgi:hypothetical protein